LLYIKSPRVITKINATGKKTVRPKVAPQRTKRRWQGAEAKVNWGGSKFFVCPFAARSHLSRLALWRLFLCIRLRPLLVWSSGIA